MHTVEILRHLVENHLFFTYFLIFLVTIFEGEIIAISAGILVLLGALNFWFALGCVFLGGMVKTFGGYFLGCFIYRKFNKVKFFQYVEKRVRSVMPHFQARPFWSIFISKFIMMNHLVILYAGYKKINFKKYLQAEITSTIFWAPGMMLLGYFFSYAAIKVSDEIWQFSLVVVGLVVIFICIDKFLGWIYEIFEEFYDKVE